MFGLNVFRLIWSNLPALADSRKMATDPIDLTFSSSLLCLLMAFSDNWRIRRELIGPLVSELVLAFWHPLVVGIMLVVHPNFDIYLRFEAIVNGLLPAMLHPVSHFLVTTLSQRFFEMALYPTSAVMFFLVFCFNAIGLSVAISAILLNIVVYVWPIAVVAALAYRYAFERHVGSEPGRVAYVAYSTTARALLDLADRVAHEYQTSEHFLVGCTDEGCTTCAQVEEPSKALAELGSEWSTLYGLDADTLRQTERKLRTIAWIGGSGSMSGAVAAGVADLVQVRLKNRTPKPPPFYAIDLMVVFDELFRVFYNSILPRPFYLPPQPRWRALLFLIAPPPLPRLFAKIHKFVMTAAYPFGRLLTAVQCGPLYDFEDALHAYCKDTEGTTCQHRIAYKMYRYLRGLEYRLDAQKHEEDLQYRILIELFEWKERKFA